MDMSPISQGFAAYPVSFANNSSTSPANNPTNEQQTKNTELSPEDSRKVEELKARDAEVRAHELAHLAAAGGLAVSGANFSYERGPDGASYAVAGEVKIDTSPGKDPEDTLRRAQTIQTAALAPAEPSATDRKVAAEAVRMETAARAELAELEEVKATEEQEEAEEKEEKKQANAAEMPVSPINADPASINAISANPVNPANNQPLTPAIKQYQAVAQNSPSTKGGFHLAV